MGCLGGRIWLSDGLAGGVNVEHLLRGSCSFEDSLAGSASTETSLRGMARVETMLRGRCGIICTIGESDYLIVEPNDIVWLTPDNDFAQELAVYSNVNWTVE